MGSTVEMKAPRAPGATRNLAGAKTETWQAATDVAADGKMQPMNKEVRFICS